MLHDLALSSNDTGMIDFSAKTEGVASEFVLLSNVLVASLGDL